MGVWIGDATVGVGGIVPVGGGGVDVEMEEMGSGVPPGNIRIRNRKITSRIIATISLNRS
jgi:hypothetical protein